MKRFPHQWDDSRSRAARRGRTRRQQRQRRPELEGLEVRALLSTITEYKSLPSNSGANGIASDGVHLWVAEGGKTNEIAEIDPSTGAVIQQISVPVLPAAPIGATAQPYSIVVDNGGKVWFTEDGDGGIGMYDPNHPTAGVTSYPLPRTPGGSYDPGAQPEGLTVAPDGNIWFTENAANLVGWINPASTPPNSPSTTKVYPLPPGGTNPDQITSTPDGRIWFTETNANAIGMFDPANPSAGIMPISLQIPAGMSGKGIAVGSDGNLWIGLQSPAGTGGAVLRVNSKASAQQTIYLDNASGFSRLGVAYVTAGNDGKIWFSEASDKNTTGTLGVIDPASPGTPQLQSTSVSYSQAAWLVKGPSGIVWFTDANNNSVGVVNSTVPAPPPVISSVRLNSYVHHNKKGRPVGNPVAEVLVTFSTTMNTGTIDNAGNYHVAWKSTKRVKQKVQTILHFVSPPTFQASDSSSTVVALVTSVPMTKFAKGGQVQVVSPGSILSAAGVSLGEPTTKDF
jgi:virginiamycin B lyase